MTMHTFKAMTLSAQHIKLVQNSWRILRDIDSQLIGDLFYSKLFFDHPEARIFFPEEMTAQHQKLIGMFNIIFARLDQLKTIQKDIIHLAERHVHYGVLPQHYDWVGASLIWTLQHGLRDEWNPKLEEAWCICYETLANKMKKVYNT